MPEMKELIAAMGRPNVGIVLDSWHWYTSGGTVADLKTLTQRTTSSASISTTRR